MYKVMQGVCKGRHVRGQGGRGCVRGGEVGTQSEVTNQLYMVPRETQRTTG